MKFFHNIYMALLVFFISIAIFGFSLYHYCFSPVGDTEFFEKVEIEPGSIDSIGVMLEEKGYIRSKIAFKAYIRITGKSNLKAGVYSLNKKMSLVEIVNILAKGSNFNEDYIEILFKEGLNMRKIASIIANNTNNTEDAVYDLLKDEKYLKSLINNYWFIDESILNDKIYYSLEGYLYPSTYYFDSEDVSVERIFKSMLDEMEKQLEEYKEDINNNKYSVHEILTLASIVELEGVTPNDRKKIAGVFYNRIKNNDTLGSDVTTYYGARISMGDRDLYTSELNECNGYNTRCKTFKGLPVSPISNPSISSIEAVIRPKKGDYYYFVADKNRKVYFTKTLSEHNNTIARLKREGLWYVY